MELEGDVEEFYVINVKSFSLQGLYKEVELLCYGILNLILLICLLEVVNI